MNAPTIIDQPGAPSFDKISKCVHCGLCLEACPTYREERVEMDSPRGRIYLMKGLLQGRLQPTDSVLSHIDRCLDCRACETACPSGVEYSQILERTRTVLQPLRVLSPAQTAVRTFAFGALLPNRLVQWGVFKLLWLGKVLGFMKLGAWLGQKELLPGRLSNAASQAPDVPFSSFRSRHRARRDPMRNVLVFPALGEQKHRVAFFTGCLADQLFADVNDATVEVLTRNGCLVEVLLDERCCGALHIHNGARDAALGLAADNVRSFSARTQDSGAYDAIVSNAPGCSAELKHYGELLDQDPAAVSFGKQIRDVSEFLVQIGWVPPKGPGSRTGRLAYDEPCHLLHAQKISDPPKQILRSIPGLTMTALDEADACCGSAGAYSLLQPDLAGRVSGRKIENIRNSGAQIVATGNPGCLLQIQSGVRKAGLPVEVVHPIVLLADAYQKSG